MRNDSPWSLLRWWHLIVFILLMVPLAGSLYLGDARPVVFSFWWIGFLTVGLGVLFGVGLSFTGFGVMLWHKLRGRKPKPGEDS